MGIILTLNAGSSSVKFSVYERATEPRLLIEGQVENLGPDAHLELHGPAKAMRRIGEADHHSALTAILEAIGPVTAGLEVVGIGHRIVHGGGSCWCRLAVHQMGGEFHR